MSHIRITCTDEMGYIYLKPSDSSMPEPSRNTLQDHLTPEQIRIPCTESEQTAAILDRIPLSPNTFKREHGKSYETEYGNDMDEHGYIIGIELTLPSERFIELVRQQTIQIVKTHWKNKTFRLVAFERMDNVLRPDNRMYRLTDAEDAFVIVYLEKPENLGYAAPANDSQLPIALFKAFLSARDDIYPPEYLAKPEFILRQSGMEEIENRAANIGWKRHLNDEDMTPEMTALLERIFGKRETE